MLELKTYTKLEMVKMFGTKDTQGLKRKLERYGVTFDVSGRGENIKFHIKEINNPFKLYCITELDCDGRTDFYTLRNFYYYFFNDDIFMSMPDEVKETMMRSENHLISRKTIAKYISKLEKKDLIQKNSGEYLYYFAYQDKQRLVEKEEYTKAWKEYWLKKNEGIDAIECIYMMICDYGGVARKQEKPQINGIYKENIKYLCDLIHIEIEKDLSSFKSLIYH